MNTIWLYRKYITWLPFCLVWTCVLLLSACTRFTYQPIATPDMPEATPSPLMRGQTTDDPLRLILWEAPTILNPHISVGLKDFFASRITYEPLASFDRHERLVPFLAAEIPDLENGGVAADGMWVIWKLKQGVLWSDGTPFTADDVRFTYEFITNPAIASHAAVAYETVKQVEVIDDYTIKIHFKQPNPAWATPFVGRQGLILPRHKFEAYNGANVRDAPANMEPVGTGPYRVVSFKPQEVVFLGYDLVETNKIIYEPNPFFREADKLSFSRIELRGGGTVQQAGQAVLVDGTADYAYNMQAHTTKLQPAPPDAPGHLEQYFGSTIIVVELNATDPNQGSLREFPHPIFSDQRVRQAIAAAIDRQHIATTIYGDAGRPISNMLIAPERYQSPHTTATFDPERAAALLTEAGWVDTDGNGIRDKEGHQLRLVYQSALNPQLQPVQESIKHSLEQIGIEVVLEVRDASVFYGGDPDNHFTVERFAADIQQYDTPSPTPDPGPYLGYWTCGQIPQPDNNWSGFNSARWCNPLYDDLLAQTSMELDPERRRELFITMNDLMVEDGFLIPIVNIANVAAVSNSLQGIELTPWDADVWMIKDWKRRTS